ncbi:MAG: SpoIIE family protein phosphatase [Chloroflexota bacterium]
MTSLLPLKRRSASSRATFVQQIKLLGIIGIILLIFMVFLGTSLVLQFQQQVEFAESGVTLSLRPITQLQRELLRLTALVQADTDEFDSMVVELQKGFVESRFQVIPDTLTQDVGPEELVLFNEVETKWQSLQPLLEQWQADPTNPTLRISLIEGLVETEFLINNLVSRYDRFRLEKATVLTRAGQRLFTLLSIGFMLSIIFVGIVALSTYRFILDRQQNEKELKTYQNHLEDLVLIRTQELNEKNHILETTLNQLTESEEQHRLIANRLQQELVLARQIQQGLLPDSLPDQHNLEVVCYSTPAQAVGGDFYAYHTFEQGHFGMAIGDISGKGMSAALLMAITLASFQSVVKQTTTPTELVNQLEQAILPYTTRQNCALTYVEITPPQESTGHLKAINAGGISPIIKRNDGSVEWVDAQGIPLGTQLNIEANYQTVTTSLSRGDLVILVSDGVVESLNEAGEMFSFDI